MIDARLRRLCELKPSGKCKWKKGGTSRVWLDKLDLDKDPYIYIYDQLCNMHVPQHVEGDEPVTNSLLGNPLTL